MQRPLTSLFLSLSIALFLAGLFGCGGGDPTGPGPDPGPDWPDGMALPAEDEQAMAEATDLLRALRAGEGIDAARDSLLQRVADGWPGIASARLGSDGVTITLLFEDGAGAVLFTDESVFGEWEPPQGVPRGPEHRVYRDGELKVALECGDVIAPPNRKVHIVNLAGASNPESRQYTADLEQYLQDLGWEDGEIDISQRESYDDTSITPDTVFEQEGYGIVLFIAHGGFRWDEQGTEHFVMQTFRGGDYDDGYEGYVTEERWVEYVQWKREGKLDIGSAWCEPDSAYQRHVNVRDDLLVEQMQLEEGAMVSFVCCNSWQLDDELTALGAGSVLAWDGSTNGGDGMNSWLSLFDGLSDPDGPGSDAETLASMKEDGYGYSTGHSGERTEMKLGGDERAWHLPATLDFLAPGDCLPAGTHHYEVDVRFPDCPEYDVSFDFFPGGGHSLPPLPPTGAEIELRAKDASGNTLDAGLYDIDLYAGTNPFDLCPCEGSLLLDLTDYPLGGDYAASSVHVDLSYDDPTLGVESFDLALPLDGLEGLVPGGATLDISVLTAGGDVLGTAGVDGDAACDDPRTASFCVGWFSLETGSYPTDTTEIVVTAPGEADALPAVVTMAPDGTGEMYGFALGSTVTLAAEAFNDLGVSLGTSSVAAEVTCGANAVEVDFANYGIVLEASATGAPADGISQVSITATLREFQEGDLLEPTGDPVVGKTVEFDAGCGDFVGAPGGTTDASGEVVVAVVSDEPCLAAVHAFVIADLVESRPVYVNFEARMSFWIDGTSSSVEDISDGRTFVLRCGTLRFYFNDQFIIERLIATYHGQWGAYNPGWALPGDRIRLEISPWVDPEHYDCYDNTRTELGATWVHTAYEPDFVHQGLHQLGSSNPLNGTVNMEVTVAEIDHYADKAGSSASRDLDGLFALLESLGEGETTVRWVPLRRACD